MLEVIRDDNGNMVAVCEWLLLNNQGQLDETADTMFIGEVEINKQYRYKGILKQFIRTLVKKCPQVERCFFFRKTKYPNRDYTLWTKKQFESIIK